MITQESHNSLLEAVRDFAIDHLNITDITTAEDEIQKMLQVIGNTMMQEVAAKMSGKPTYSGVRIDCECSKEADFKGYRKRWIKTLHGDVAVERGYYRCRECHRTYIQPCCGSVWRGKPRGETLGKGAL